MTEPVALLENVVELADTLLGQPQLWVSAEALRTLREEVSAERARMRERPRAIDDEALILLTAIHRISDARRDGANETEQRWTWIAKSFLPFLRADLARELARIPTA